MSESDNTNKYKSFIDKLKLKDIYMKSIHVNRFVDEIQNRNFSLNLKFDEVYHDYNKVQNSLKYSIKFICNCIDADDETNVFDISTTFIVKYNLDGEDDFDDEFFKQYKSNAIFNVWPFIRSTIKDITNRIDVPTPPLPLYKQ